MKIRASYCSVLAALLLTGPLMPARAEPIPAPTGVLRDFSGSGIIQIEIPATGNPQRTSEKPNAGEAGVPDAAAEPQAGPKKEEAEPKFVASGTFLVFNYRQAYVRPDCYLMETLYLGAREISTGIANTERTFAIGSTFVVDRVFKNIDPVRDNPMRVARSSLATYGRVFSELTSGKLLPAENLDLLKQTLTRRILELAEIRRRLRMSVDPADIPEANASAAEQARLRDELEQLELRKKHPCHIVRFENKDVMQALLAKGLHTGFSSEMLDGGTTTIWLTKAEGLPIKIETTASNGRLALFVILNNFKINSGLRPGDLTLGVPPNAQLIRAVADIQDLEWEQKLEKEVSAKLARLEEQRLAEKQAEKFQKPKKR